MLSGVRAVAAVLYRLIARTRHLMPGDRPACQASDGAARDADGQRTGWRR
jgi:hypothetical protein